jgi:hypothetical protein
MTEPTGAHAPRRSRAVLPPVKVTAPVIVFALAMAYLESAVVVYLREALGVAADAVFPLDLSSTGLGQISWIEVGREAATLLMIGAVGWIAGRSPWERLAWAAVVFGAWDIGYYFWLWVFSGWPSGLGTWDLLFLLPLPWAGPVWAPVVVSLALIGFGLVMAARCRAGADVHAGWGPFTSLMLGGVVVIVSFVLNAGVVLDGGTPVDFAWPVFWLGMAIGVVAATLILRSMAAPAASGAPAPGGAHLGHRPNSSTGAQR